jgi:hypothetical protein
MLATPEAFYTTLRPQLLERGSDQVQADSWTFALKIADAESSGGPLYCPDNQLGIERSCG